MLLAAILPAVLGANIAWTDSRIGSRPIRSDSGSFPHRIRSVAELVAVLEITSDRRKEDNAVPADSTVRRFEKEPCKIATVDTLDGNVLSLVSWGAADSGFTFLLATGKDSTEAVDFFHHRPTGYSRDASGIRMSWQRAGKPCQRFSYSARLEQGEFRFAPDSATAALGRSCKDPQARKAFRTRLERESDRRTGNRCDVMAVFPTVGYCWQDQAPEGEDDLDAP